MPEVLGVNVYGAKRVSEAGAGPLASSVPTSTRLSKNNKTIIDKQNANMKINRT